MPMRQRARQYPSFITDAGLHSRACRHVGVQNLSYASSSSAPYKIYNIGNNNPVELLPLQAEDVPATFANVDDLVEDLG